MKTQFESKQIMHWNWGYVAQLIFMLLIFLALFSLGIKTYADVLIEKFPEILVFLMIFLGSVLITVSIWLLAGRVMLQKKP